MTMNIMDIEERIPILKPGHFDGMGSWKDFIHRFESCAMANHWSDATMAVQTEIQPEMARLELSSIKIPDLTVGTTGGLWLK